MALRQKVLRKKAEKLELKGLKNNNITLECMPVLEKLLHDTYVSQHPKPSDYESRRNLVCVFNEIAKEIYGHSGNCPVVEEFGSFSMDIFSAKSDLDLSVNFGYNSVEFSREKKIKTLQKFAKKLYAVQSKGHVSGILPVMTAKVPILKVVDKGTGIECDISVENRDGILKSHIIRIISSIDERFQKLSFLMKAWARAHNINSSKDRTLNSLSIILLVAFHLQTRDPPILPPFSAILKDGTDPAAVVKLLPNFSNYGKRNKESLGQLFVTLLVKLSSVENLWPKGLCASTYEGSWISKAWPINIGCISVEDFTNRSQNVARAVGTAEVKTIHKCIQLSMRYVFAFMDGQIQGHRLCEFLFGVGAFPTPVDIDTANIGQKTGHNCIPVEPRQRKRKRPTETCRARETIAFDPIPTVRMRYVEDREGMPTEGWAGKRVNACRAKPHEDRGRVPAGSWGGRSTEVCQGTQHAMPFDTLLRMRSVEGLGDMPPGSLRGTQLTSHGFIQQEHFVPVVNHLFFHTKPVQSVHNQNSRWRPTISAWKML